MAPLDIQLHLNHDKLYSMLPKQWWSVSALVLIVKCGRRNQKWGVVKVSEEGSKQAL